MNIMCEDERFEMPVPCTNCGEIFELNDGYGSEKWYKKVVICERCHEKELEEIEEDERWCDINIELSDALFMFENENAWEKLTKENAERLKKIPIVSEFKIESVDRFWHYCGRNCKNYVEITHWYNSVTLEKKETKRSESFFPSEEYRMPDWCNSIRERRKDLDAEIY